MARWGGAPCAERIALSGSARSSVRSAMPSTRSKRRTSPITRCPSDHGQPAADRERLAGDVRGAVSDEDRHGWRDVGGLRSASERDGPGEAVVELLGVLGDLA